MKPSDDGEGLILNRRWELATLQHGAELMEDDGLTQALDETRYHDQPPTTAGRHAVAGAEFVVDTHNADSVLAAADAVLDDRSAVTLLEKTRAYFQRHVAGNIVDQVAPLVVPESPEAGGIGPIHQ